MTPHLEQRAPVLEYARGPERPPRRSPFGAAVAGLLSGILGALFIASGLFGIVDGWNGSNVSEETFEMAAGLIVTAIGGVFIVSARKCFRAAVGPEPHYRQHEGEEQDCPCRQADDVVDVGVGPADANPSRAGDKCNRGVLSGAGDSASAVDDDAPPVIGRSDGEQRASEDEAR